MATTESRAGFRLPWSSDRAAAQSSELDETDPQAADTAGATDPQDLRKADHPTTEASNEASNEAGTATPGPDQVEPSAPHAPGDRGSAGAPVVPPRARPTKFLAELTRAMQAAAELSRASTIASLQADANAFIEEIRGRSAGQVEFLRHNTDADIAAIRDWSKAEIARIREESDARITIRRNRLEQHLERHAALVEDEVRKVQAQIASFEAEMERFFSELLTEDDPTEFAARAAQLPEPPTFTGIGEDALVALLNEPLVEDAAVPDEPLVEDSSALLAGDMPLAGATDEAPGDASGVPEAVLAQPADDTTVEAGDAEGEAGDAEGEAEIVEPGPETLTEPEPEAVAAEAEAEPQTEPVAIEIVSGADEQAEDAGRAIVDETSEFDAAEAAAAEAAAAALQGMETMSGDFLAARLGGFEPATPTAPAEPDLPVASAAQAPANAAPVVATQVIVSGLVSVASIAAFKRNLGGLPGVEGVGVSSGPDGEFVFNVRHADGVVVRDLVVSLPGFRVQVTGGGDGVVTANAHDPES